MPEFGTISITPGPNGSAVISDAAMGGEAVIAVGVLDDAVSYLATMVPPADDDSVSAVSAVSAMSVRVHPTHLTGDDHDDEEEDAGEFVDLDPAVQHHTTRPAEARPPVIVDAGGHPLTVEEIARRAAEQQHPSNFPPFTVNPPVNGAAPRPADQDRELLLELLSVAEQVGNELLVAAASIRGGLTVPPPTYALGGQLPGFAHGVAG